MATHRLRFAVKFMVAVGLMAGMAAAQEQETRYDQLVSSPAMAQTVRSLGTVILAAPHESDEVRGQLRRIWWTQQEELDLSEAEAELASVNFRRQLTNVTNAVARHDLRELTFSGYSKIGTVQNLDLYFSGDGPRGPVVFRVSLQRRDDAEPVLHEIEVFEGWKSARAEVRHIDHRPGKTFLSVSYKPAPDPTPDDGGEETTDDAGS